MPRQPPQTTGGTAALLSFRVACSPFQMLYNTKAWKPIGSHSGVSGSTA